MTHDQIAAWAGAGESETQEFKRPAGQRREAARTICAMLNHRGGRVLFGVEPDARVVGQQVSDHTLEEVVRELHEIEPPVFPSIERVAVTGGREVLVVSVDAGHSQPYSFRGQAFRRVGATNQTLSREEYNRVLLERLHADSRWELQPATGWSVSDLDQEEIRRTLEAGIQAGRIEDPDTRDPLAILRGLGLVKQDVLLRAAVVLFGRSARLLPDFTQCLLRVARFRGMEKGEFLDNRQFNGHAFDLFQRAQRFLLDHMPIAGRFEPGRMERIDEPAYSPLAFREAIANAICHRDYATGGSSIGVAMYDDRLEITSSGTLHFGFTPQSLFEPHESRPWNPLIASVFYKRGIIETWGQGTIRMASWAQAAGLPAPEILEIPGAVVVRFRRAMTGETPEKTEALVKTPVKTPEDELAPGKAPGKTQVAVLELLREGPYLTVAEMATRLDRSESAINRAIRQLRESGRLERVGPDKGGSWKVLR
jgi:ATP-dependent DNA helicase RecG